MSTFSKILFFLILTGLISFEISGFCQQNRPSTDSLSLDRIIKQVIQTHPSVKEAEEAINIADAKIGLAQSGYLPNIGISAKYTRLWPLTSLTIPFNGQLETFSLYPANNYDAELDYSQTIYDFGRTSRNIAYEKATKELSEQSLEQWKQRMSMMATMNFYHLVYYQEAIQIKNEQLDNLHKHLNEVEKMQQTGSATKYEILTTQVRISSAESEKTDLEFQLKSEMSVLNSLLGEPQNSHHNVKKEFTAIFSELPEDSLISIAINNRDEMKMAQQQETLAELRLNVTKANHYPNLNVFASGGEKNGYIPDLNVLKLNYAAGVGLQIPIFDASRTKNNIKLAKSAIQNSSYETEITRRNITNDVIQNEANIVSSKQKVEQFRLQFSHAQEALTLAEISYRTGAITNLDLLDATTRVSESRLQLLKAQTDYVMSIYKLKVALGEKLY